MGRKRGYPKRGHVIRMDDPDFEYDIRKRPKRERMAASRDGYLRASKERKKWLKEDYEADDGEDEQG